MAAKMNADSDMPPVNVRRATDRSSDEGPPTSWAVIPGVAITRSLNHNDRGCWGVNHLRCNGISVDHRRRRS